ncbi:MAG: class I SAM-dependent methyltransferase [Bacilli bacterium]|nr:class I SAM-dependent methyltransferase [Bacilli bacterium]
MNKESVNKKLVEFWDNAFLMSKEDKEELDNLKEQDYKELAPSKKLYEAVASLKDCNKVLDYGCGSAWGAIIASKEGAKIVTAVDLGENIINRVNLYKDKFRADIHAFSIEEDWLNTVENEAYEAIICSNVLDVLPLETSEYILKEFSRIIKKGGRLVIGLNYFLSKEKAKERNLNLEEDKYLYLDGVLRLTSLSDNQWISLFNKNNLDVESLDYFAWPRETKETRRLFILRKK